MEFIISEFVGKRSSKAKMESRLIYERKYGCEALPLRYSSFWSHMDDILPKVPLTRHMVRVRIDSLLFILLLSQIYKRSDQISFMIVATFSDISLIYPPVRISLLIVATFSDISLSLIRFLSIYLSIIYI